MSDVSDTTLRGLLIPDPRLTYADAYSSSSVVTQQGPIAGVPVAVNESEMVLESGGTQAAGTVVHLRVRSGGHPRPDGASFAWRYSTDASTDNRGWDPPTSITGFAALDYTTTANQWREPFVMRRADDGLVAVCLKSRRYIRAWTRPATSTAWTERVVYDTGATVTNAASPCTLQLPGGRILLFHWVEVTATQNQVRMHYSDDDGVTWTTGQQTCLLTPLTTSTYTPGRLRCGYLNGEVLLVASVLDTSGAQSRDRLVQYASDDLGTTFSQVSITAAYTAAADFNSRAYAEVTVVGGRFLVTYIKTRSSGTGNRVPFRKFLGQAFDSLASAPEDIAVQTGNTMEWGTISGTNYFTGGELATWLDDDGVLWMAGDDFSDNHPFYCQRSTDGGQTWAMVGSGSAAGFGSAWWNGRDAATHPTNITGCSHQGRAVVLHNFAANPGTADASLCAVYLGGYTTVTLPNLAGEAVSVKSRASWERTWLPYDEPENVGGVWNRTLGGAPTIALSGGELTYSGGAGDSVAYYTAAAPSGTIAEGVMVLIDGYCTTASATGGAMVNAQVGDGADGYSVRVAFSNQNILVRDLQAGADLVTVTDSDAVTAASTGIQILLQVYNPAGGGAGNTGRYRAWWRSAVPGTDSDRKWVEIGSSTTLQTGAIASYVAWGAMNGVTTGARFRVQCFSNNSYAGAPLYAFSNPADLLGRTFSNTLAYVDDGLRVRMVAGPAFRGDEATITADYNYPIRNIFSEVSPSPAQGWRSVDTSNDEFIRLDYDSVLAQNSEMLGNSIGIYLGNINFEYCELQAATAGGIFNTIATLSAKTGQQGMGFTRNGDELTVSVAHPGTNSIHWYTYNTLRNSYVKMTSGGDPAVTRIRKILHNSEGAWRATGTKTARLLLEGVLSGDPTGDTATSTCEFWSKDLMFVINDVAKYAAFRIRIPSQSTYEGDFRIGTLLLGHMAWFGQKYSRGRILGTDPNTQVTTSRSGARRAVNNGGARRSVQFGWVEGVDTSSIATTPTEPQPNTVSASTGGVAEAAYADTPYKVAGLAEALRGAFTPVVYVAKYARPAAASTDTTMVNRNTFLHARLVTPVQLESIIGTEWASDGEVFSVGTVTLEEEL
jgi:hypothetical protein